MNHTIPNIQCGYLHRDHPVHGHPCWEIHLFTQGNGVFDQADQQHTIAGYLLFLSPPGYEHGIKVRNPLTFFYIQYIEAAETQAVLEKLYQNQVKRGPLRVSAEQVEELERIKRKCDHTTSDLQLSGVHHFTSWLYELGAITTETKQGDRIDRAIAYMRQRIERKLTLNQVALVAGMDRFHFSRQFKERTGQSPMDWFMAGKVEAGSFLLCSTDLPLSEIAQRLGFCDEFHFNKVFRARNGMPPGHWRSMHRAS